MRTEQRQGQRSLTLPGKVTLGCRELGWRQSAIWARVGSRAEAEIILNKTQNGVYLKRSDSFPGNPPKFFGLED